VDNKETSGNQLLDFLKRLGFIAQEKIQEPVTIKEIKKEHKCKECGKSFSQVKQEGYLECDSCYSTFGPLVLNSLKKIIGEPILTKTPVKKIEKKPKNIEEFLKKLELSLDYSIKKEYYEDSAKLRDKIKYVKEVLQEVKIIKEKIKEFIKLEKFEEAKEIKKQLDKIIKNCINNQS
jgi:protein-arginine kinase activator protein McsA